MAVFGSSIFAFMQSFWNQSGPALIDRGDLSNLALFTCGSVAGITAHAGGGQTNAFVLNAAYNEVDTVASANDSVMLPPAIVGRNVLVNNNAASNSLNCYSNLNNGFNPDSTGKAQADVIYPHGSSTANSSSTAIAIAAGNVAWFVCTTLGQWKEVSLLS